MPRARNASVVFGNMHMAEFLGHRAKRIGRMLFFNVCMEGVEMHQHIRLAHIVDQLGRIAQGVEEIRLETIEGLNTEGDTEFDGLSRGHLQAFYSPFPFVLRSAATAHYAQACIERATNELSSEFCCPFNALLQEFGPSRAYLWIDIYQVRFSW